MSPSSIFVRDVPDDIGKWIDHERAALRMTKNEFMITLIRKAAEREGLAGDLVGPAVSEEVANPSFTFIDLFAGIGGFRIGLSRTGGRCLFTSEWDAYAQKTYLAWFGEVPHGDIRKVKPEDIPNHDVLAAGFPCQPFSIAGVSKKNSLGRAHGFSDETQGTLFFHIAQIAASKRPPVLFLENVKNLTSHDKGRTWTVIVDTLEGLGYKVFSKIIDAQNYVPQHRERIFIVAFDRQRFGDNAKFSFPDPPVAPPRGTRLADVLDSRVDSKYTLSDHLWNYLQAYAKKHREKGNGFGFGLTALDGITRTLSARYYKDGSEILIPQGKGKNPRRLTPVEAGRLMGFPDEYLDKIAVSDTQAYRQFGNAVCPLVVEAIGQKIAAFLKRERNRARVTAAAVTKSARGALAVSA